MTTRTKAEYIMVGGFLGAGKTTALLRLAGHLTRGGKRVGLITNDQSYGLVDTAVVSAQGYPVEEITGGCFCCRFDSLTAAAERLSAETRPDVFLAEPVGSCTDLRASVQYPLRQLYGDQYRVAPLTVLLDPVRALRIMGLEPGPRFSPKVVYVYEKQLEEAEVILINKSDLLSAEQRGKLEEGLRQTYPDSEVYPVSARTGAGLDRWFARVCGAASDSRPAPAVDYDVYAEGEALLGWLNGAWRIAAAVPFDGNDFLARLARQVASALDAEQMQVAHFKMTLTPGELRDLAVINLVGNDRQPELSHRLQDDLVSGELVVNLRAEGPPEVLQAIMGRVLGSVTGQTGSRAELLHLEHFRPGRPSPTHRIATPAS
jgi:Ni2+-binding GTPase involved in maturation of urease and hydrogenase